MWSQEHLWLPGWIHQGDKMMKKWVLYLFKSKIKWCYLNLLCQSLWKDFCSNSGWWPIFKLWSSAHSKIVIFFQANYRQTSPVKNCTSSYKPQRPKKLLTACFYNNSIIVFFQTFLNPYNKWKIFHFRHSQIP